MGDLRLPPREGPRKVRPGYDPDVTAARRGGKGGGVIGRGTLKHTDWRPPQSHYHSRAPRGVGQNDYEEVYIARPRRIPVSHVKPLLTRLDSTTDSTCSMPHKRFGSVTESGTASEEWTQERGRRGSSGSGKRGEVAEKANMQSRSPKHGAAHCNQSDENRVDDAENGSAEKAIITASPWADILHSARRKNSAARKASLAGDYTKVSELYCRDRDPVTPTPPIRPSPLFPSASASVATPWNHGTKRPMMPSAASDSPAVRPYPPSVSPVTPSMPSASIDFHDTTELRRAPHNEFSFNQLCIGGVLLRHDTYTFPSEALPLAHCNRVAVCGMFYSGNHPVRDYGFLFDEDVQPRRRTRKHKWESDLEFPVGPPEPSGSQQWGLWKHHVPDTNWNVPDNVAVLCCVRDPMFVVPRLATDPYCIEPLSGERVKKGEKAKISKEGRYLFDPIALRPRDTSRHDQNSEWHFENIGHLWRTYVYGFLTGQMCTSHARDRQRFFVVRLEDVQRRPKEVVDELASLGLKLLEPDKPFAPLDAPAKLGCAARSQLIANNAPDKRRDAWADGENLVDCLRVEIDPDLLEVLDYEQI